MSKDIILHTSDICGDGIGDLYILLNWLKVFSRKYRGSNPQYLLLFADKASKVANTLLELKDVEPEHPIFKFLTVKNKSIQSATVGGIKIGVLKQTEGPLIVLDIKSVFPNINPDDCVIQIKVSASGVMLSGQQKTRLMGIFEFDAIVPAFDQTAYRCLGLGENNWGLLHDLDGANGTQDLDSCLDNLTTNTKKLLFNDPNINNQMAREFLATTPIVFAYLFPLYMPRVLEAAFLSPIVQQAIQKGKVPVFFITNAVDGVELPQIIEAAASVGKIRIVKVWLTTAEFKSMNAIFMNKDTISIIVPSGDNTLTDCIKAGKFPLYAHKDIPAVFKPFEHSKLSIFKDMLKILTDNAQEQGWDKEPGLKHCIQTLYYLSQATLDVAKGKAVAEKLPTFITADMLAFFRDKLAPYLMQHYAFEHKAMPSILSIIETPPLAASSNPASRTTQFKLMQQYQTQMLNLKSAAETIATLNATEAASTGGRTAAKNSPAPKAAEKNTAEHSDFGFRAGFLNPKKGT